MKHRVFLPLILVLSACMPATPGNVPTRSVLPESILPQMKTFATARPAPTTRSNVDIARDFIALNFEMESGTQLPVLTRFENPVTLHVTGDVPPTLRQDLSKLLARLRSEANITITPTTSPQASITVQAVPRARIQSVLPQAACFVGLNVRSLREYTSARRSPRTDWTQLQTRTHLAIFVPSDGSPQDLRDCLHEEIAQALGPLNDLYRLPNSVFNDDDIYSVLTNFDMLILRTLYDPQLRSGMTREAVAARLPSILTRLNPRGQTAPSASHARTPKDWGQAIGTALGPRASASARIKAANRAVRIANSVGWTDHRAGFSHAALGRLLRNAQPDAAFRHYMAADRFYAQTPEAEVYRADLAQYIAGHLIAAGEHQRALDVVDRHIDTAYAAQNAALLANLLGLRAKAHDELGQTAQARAVSLDSLGWSLYGFGATWASANDASQDVAFMSVPK